MAGRHRVSHHPEHLHGYPDDPPHVWNCGPAPLSIHPAALEEELELEFQHREMQRIIADNHNVADENRLLQRELMAAKDEIHLLGQVIPQLQAEKEAYVRELTQRGLKLEAEARAVEPLKIEAKQLRVEVWRLDTTREELESKVQGLQQDISRVKAENQQLPSMRADVELMRKELFEARRAVEYERKAHEEQVEQRHLIERQLISMAHEIEQLRAELVTVGRRTQGYGGGAYAMFSGSPKMGYQGDGFGNDHSGARGHHNKQDPVQR